MLKFVPTPLYMLGGGEQRSNNVKLILVGAQSTGKTSIIQRYVRDKFVPTSATLAFAYEKKTVRVSNTQQEVNLQLWDTAGQERFDAITPTYYRSCGAVALVCSLDQGDSLQKAGYWLNQVEQNADIGTKVYLVVNKCDLQDDETALNRALVDQFCQLHNLEQFNVSAKTGAGVSELM